MYNYSDRYKTDAKRRSRSMNQRARSRSHVVERLSQCCNDEIASNSLQDLLHDSHVRRQKTLNVYLLKNHLIVIIRIIN